MASDREKMQAMGTSLTSGYHGMLLRMRNLSKPVIVAMNGDTMGGGFELSLSCDIRIGQRGDHRFGLPEVKLGLIPGWGGTVRAVRLFGSSVARRMILSGELLPAVEAARLGIVDAVVPAAEFRATVEERIEKLLVGGPHAVAAVKKLIAEFEGVDIDAQLEREAEVFARCCGDKESTEGAIAFLEKRAPRWE